MSEVDLQQNNSDSKDADRNLNSDADSQSVTTPTVSNPSEGSAKNKTPAPDGPESQSQNHEELTTVESHPQNTDNGLGVDGDKQLIETTADGENSEIKDNLNDLQSAKTKEQSNATQDDTINQPNESVSSENVTESTQMSQGCYDLNTGVKNLHLSPGQARSNFYLSCSQSTCPKYIVK